MISRIILYFGITSCVVSQDVTVPTAYGKVRGKVEEFNHAKFTVFHGIPYAAPPVGDLRWQPPQRHNGWGDSTRDAFEIGPVCPQLLDLDWSRSDLPSRLFHPMQNNDTQSEDCLLLEVYVTGDLSSDVKLSLPVIVFIHGGGFIMGSSCFEQGEVFVTAGQPVVMVAIQYRLGLLGFFTTGDDTLSANFGLRDQTFALQWVQENIAAFGGDPMRVTMTGESAGGMSVVSHVISPMSDGLFHRACVQSAVTAWLFPKKELLKSHFVKFAETLGCEGTTEEAVACLREKPWKDLFNLSVKEHLRVMSRVIDGEFFTENPWDSFINGNFNNAEFMVGFTSDDGKLFTDIVDPNFDFISNRTRDEEFLNSSVTVMLKAHVEDLIDYFAQSLEGQGKIVTNRKELYTVIKARYFDVFDTELERARGILQANTDAMFAASSLKMANEVARFGGKVFVYSFNHVTESLKLDVPGGVELRAPHAGELMYQFGYGFTDPEIVQPTEDETALTRSIIHAWTSFAAGDTSYLTMSGEKVEWPLYTLHEPNVLYFDTDMSPKSANHDTRWQPVVDFWDAVKSLANFAEPEDPIEEQVGDVKEEL